MEKDAIRFPPNDAEEDIYHLGEIPQNVPGEIVIPIPGIKSEDDFKNGLRDKKVSHRIQDLQEKGHELAASWSAGRITLFVAKHKKELAGVGVMGAGAIGTLLYLRKRQKK